MLQLSNIKKEYYVGENIVYALKGVDISFRENEFVAILGQSGCGKTTLLNIIGGLDRMTSGDLIIDGISTKDFNDRDWDTYRNHRVGFIFQSYNLIPHLDVISNVEIALKISGMSKEQRLEKARRALEEVGLGKQLYNKPSQMSGGQMQRVAIARALVNDPSIVLADEPTGALDSETSVQIMDILAQVAKNRLVVMVTHNPELAEEYATRIVKLKDGLIISDSNPPSKQELYEKRRRQKDKKHSKLNFSTAMGLSFRNLLSKKGRTILTAFAGAIGIIGIAAILSLSNGVQNYINTVEEDTLSLYPLSIQSSGYDITSLLSSSIGDDEDEDNDDSNNEVVSSASSNEDDGYAHEVKIVTQLFESVQNNDLASLKEFIDEDGGDIDQYVNAIDYSYDITPQIYSSDTTDGIHQINPNSSLSQLGIGNNPMASMMSINVSTDVFSELKGNSSIFEEQYNIVAGKWPTEYNECVMVLGRNAHIPDFYLYALGFKDQTELQEMVKAFVNGEEIEEEAYSDTIDVSYDQILGLGMVVINEAQYYQYDEHYGIWIDKTDDEEYMRNLIAESEKISIVGVAVPNPNASVLSLETGVLYHPSLITHLVNNAQDMTIVEQQLANPTLNVFTGKDFTDDSDTDFDFSSIIEVDENALTNAFNIDRTQFEFSYPTFDMENMNYDDLGIDLSSIDVERILQNIPPPTIDSASLIDTTQLLEEQRDIIQQETTALAQRLSAAYAQAYAQALAAGQNLTWSTFISSGLAQSIIAGSLAQTSQIISANLVSQLSQNIQIYVSGYIQQVTDAVQQSIKEQINEKIQQAQQQMQQQWSDAMAQQITQNGEAQPGSGNGFSVDQEALKNAFSINMSEDELAQVIMSMFNSEEVTLDSNLSKMGYADLAKPTQIDIYPKDFESKQSIIDILDEYNKQMEDNGEDDKVVSYTDIVGTLMSSVTTIIDMISYVLIAFVAISLVVSSIMIAIITYISVLERTKEIGILRAIGASKKDVSNIFNAETFIEGLISGLFGVGITLLASIPVNIIVYNIYAVPNVMNLPWIAAIILILISIALTLFAGWFPSRIASKKDPVLALRSE